MSGTAPGRIRAHDDPARASIAYRFATNRWFTATGEAQRLQVDEDILRYAAVGEALFWATALDDTTPHPDGPNDLCLGLRFARNRATHDLLRTINDRPGLVVPFTVPFRLVHYVWREAQALPLPSSGAGSRATGQAQLAAYQQTWEGRLVDNTLRELGRHLDAELE